MKKLLTNKKLMSSLSLVLVLAMVLTNLHLGGVRAKAETTEPSAGSSEPVGYRKVSEPDAEFDNGAGAVVTSADGAVAISKTVTKVDGTVSDYKVKLNVTTTENTENAKDIAVAIVVDLSNSMEEKLEGGTTRLAAASEDIKALLEELRDKTEGNCYVSLIGFGCHAARLTNWLDINGTVEVTVEEASGCGCDGVSYRTEKKQAYDFLMEEISESNLRSLVNSKLGGGGTNLEGGLLLAKNVLSMNDVKNINKNCKFAVLLSDGEPTYHASNSNSNDTDAVQGTEGGSDHCEQADYNGAINAANTLKQAGNTVFSVFIGKKGDKFAQTYKRSYGWWTETYDAPYRDVKVSDFLGKISDEYENGKAGVFFGDNVASLSEAFKKASAAIIAASRADGWYVTDPMAPMVTMAAISVADIASKDAITFENGTLTWNLNKDNFTSKDTSSPGKVKYVYEYTYRVQLDLTSENFEDDTPYPLNGQTILHMLNNETMEFKVPFIQGKAPTFEYTVEYYKEKLNSNPKTYDKVTDDTFSGVARVNTLVAAQEGYATKYANDHFSLDSGATSLKITSPSAIGDNTLKLYYSKDKVNVTVNKKYTTVTYSAIGEKTSNTSTDSSTVKVYYGSDYAVANYNQTQIVGGLEFEYKSGSGSVTNVVTNTAINLEYEREADLREYPIKVTYHYKNHSNVVSEQTGLYTDVVTDGVDAVDVNYSQIGKSVFLYTISSAAITGYNITEIKKNGTVIDPSAYANGVIETDLTCAENTSIDIYCENTAGDLGEKVNVLVERVYTYDETKLKGDLSGVYVDHNVVTRTAISAEMYEGEWITVTDQTTDNDITYTADPANAEKLGKKYVGKNDLHIVLYYSASKNIDKATVTIYHSYFVKTAETVPAYDENGVVTGTTVSYRVDQVGTTEIDTRENLYVGTKLSNIYSYETPYTVSDSSIGVNTEYVIVPEGGLDIYVNYIKNVTDDNRDDTFVKVEHRYYRDVKYVEAGIEKHVTKQFVTSSAVFVTSSAVMGEELLVGDTYTASEVPVFDGITYVRQTENISTVLQPSGNTIIIEYLLSDVDERIPVEVNAIYQFEKYTMTVNADGEAGYHELPEIVTATAVEASNVNHFAGIDVTFAAGNVDEFADYALDGTANYTKRLGTSGNDYTFVYKLYVPLESATIAVSHEYKLTTIAENGDETVETRIVTAAAVTKYVGEKFTVAPIRNGYSLVGVSDTAVVRRLRGGMPVYDADYVYTGIVFENGNNVVLSYARTDDNSVKADYKITNVYTTRDWDESTESFSMVVTGSAFKTNVITVSPSALENYEFINMTTSPEDIATDGAIGTYLVTLVATEEGQFNEITFYHEMVIDSREYANITVKHNYFKYDTYTRSGNEAEGTYVETLNGEADKIWWIGSDFEFDSATMAKTQYNGRTYTYKSVSPASIVVDVENNVVEVTYVREYSSYIYVPPYNPPADNPPADNPPADNPPADNPPQDNPPVDDNPIVEQPGMDLEDDGQALGEANVGDDEMDLDDDGQALGDALVKTGTVPVTVFYGFGAILMLAALVLVFKRRKMV